MGVCCTKNRFEAEQKNATTVIQIAFITGWRKIKTKFKEFSRESHSNYYEEKTSEAKVY